MERLITNSSAADSALRLQRLDDAGWPARRPRHAAPPQPMPALRLVDADRGAVLQHLLRLDPADRRARFLQLTSDAMLAAYVARIDFAAAACFGSFDGASGALVALTEGLVVGPGDGRPRCIEAAFSTDAAWRRCGLARRAFAALRDWCAAGGIDRIVLHCDARNVAMRGLLRSVAAETTVDDGEVDAVVQPSRSLH